MRKESNTQIELPDRKRRGERLAKLRADLDREDDKRMRKFTRKLILISLFIFCLLLVYNLPLIMGKNHSCDEYLAMPLYKKVFYYNHPLLPNPCDSVWPFSNDDRRTAQP